MPVNWGLANDGQFDYLSSLQGLGNAALQQQNLKQQQYNFGNVQKQDAARPGLFAQAQGGDYAGAGNAALANNDLDAFKVIGGLREDQRQQVKIHSQLIGGFAASLSSLPEGPSRVAAFRAAAPQLLKQGFTQEELQGADLSDNGLRGYIAAAGATDNALEAYYKSQQPVTLADGSIELGGTPMGGGQRPIIGENPKDAPPPSYQLSPDGSQWLLRPGTGGLPTGGAVMPSGQPGGGGQASGGGVQRRGGMTPLSDNGQAALTGKYAVIKRVGGLDPDAPLSPGQLSTLTDAYIASEGRPAATNNVGNIKDGPWARSQPGYTGASGGFATFDSPQSGRAATQKLITNKYNSGFKTTRDIIEGRPVGGGQSQSAPQGNGTSVPTGIAPKDKRYHIATPEEAKAQGLDESVRWQVSPDGQFAALPAKGDKPLSESQSKAVELLGQADEANKTLGKIQGYNPSYVGQALGSLSNNNPLRGNLDQTTRRVLYAQLAFSNAALRLESGASYGQDEIAKKALTLFAQPGDGPEIIEDKRRQRAAVLKGIRVVAGPGADYFPENKPQGAGPSSGWGKAQRVK